MKKYLASLAFLWPAVFVFAQNAVEEIIADKNIDWAAEYIQHFRLTIDECQSQETAEAYVWNRVTEVKFVSPDAKLGYYESYNCIWIAEKMLKAIESYAIEVYAEPQLINKLTNDEVLNRISRTDTIAPFSTEPNEPDVIITRTIIGSDDIKGIQARIIYYHDKKNNTFGARLLAYAPLVRRVTYEQDEKVEYLPLCWIKAAPNPKGDFGKVLQSNDICWAIQTRSDANTIYFETTATVASGNNEVKVLKNQKNLRDIVLGEIKKTSRQQYDWEMNPLAPQEVSSLLNTIDTLVVFDPETYEEKITITKTNREEQIKSVRFVFIWYYDFRRKSLYCQPTFWGPNLHVTDPEGQFRYATALFYQKTD